MVSYTKGPRVRINYIITPDTNKTVIVPVHGGKDMKKGTFISILKQAGINI